MMVSLYERPNLLSILRGLRTDGPSRHRSTLHERPPPRYIYSSQVGDSICDCCDASDESASHHFGKAGVCLESCQADGEEQAKNRQAKMEEVQRAISLSENHKKNADVLERNWEKMLEGAPAKLEELKKAEEEVEKLKHAAVDKWIEEEGHKTE